MRADQLGGPKQQEYANRAYVEGNNMIPETLARNASYIEPLVAAGWKREDAELYILLSPCRMALSRALKDRDPCYAASTHQLNAAIFRSRGEATVAPPLYVNVSPFLERGFRTLELPDRTGFQGLTTTAIVKAFRDPGCFTAEGYCHPVAPGKYVSCYDTDVICFEVPQRGA